MKLSQKIWKELGALAVHVESLNHDAGTAKYKATAAAPDIAAVEAVLAAHDPLLPDPDDVAAEAIRVADAEAKAIAKADNVVKFLCNHTPAEVEAYVQAQVIDLPSARALLKKFGVALCVLAKQNLR